MRWKLKNKNKIGDTKNEIKYLWFPLCLNDECRWLEFVNVKYVYKEVLVSYDMGGVIQNKWVAIKFLPYDPVYDCEVYLTKGCSHVDGLFCNIDDCDILNKFKNKL